MDLFQLPGDFDRAQTGRAFQMNRQILNGDRPIPDDADPVLRRVIGDRAVQLLKRQRRGERFRHPVDFRPEAQAATRLCSTREYISPPFRLTTRSTVQLASGKLQQRVSGADSGQIVVHLGQPAIRRRPSANRSAAGGTDLWCGALSRTATSRPDLGSGAASHVCFESEVIPIGSAAESDAEDARDIALSLSGDGDAYRRLVERYQAEVAAQMRRFSRDPTIRDELTHDVFVEAYTSLRSYRGTAPWLHWFGTLSQRRPVSQSRRNRAATS